MREEGEREQGVSPGRPLIKHPDKCPKKPTMLGPGPCSSFGGGRMDEAACFPSFRIFNLQSSIFVLRHPNRTAGIRIRHCRRFFGRLVGAFCRAAATTLLWLGWNPWALTFATRSTPTIGGQFLSRSVCLIFAKATNNSGAVSTVA